MTNPEPEPDYCPHINQCTESRRDICYNHKEYQNCGFYEAQNTIAKVRKENEKGLAKKVGDKLGNPKDKNWGQL